MDPANFKLAYSHIQTIFNQEGVPHSSVKWVFAPNGYSGEGNPGFEYYYPGDNKVDVVAFSSYNFGFSPYVVYKGWKTYQQLYTPYLDRIRLMAPSKPIFIAQTGTTAYTVPNGVDNAAKDQWLRDTYNYLASYKGVRAIIYFNMEYDVEWQIYWPGVDAFVGYKDGVANNAYGYISPEELKNMDLTVH
jgi:beta-mannanase